jgi:hypothetical protein
MGSADEHLGTQADAQGNVSTRAQITSLQVFRTTCVVGAKTAQNSFPLWLFQHRGRSAVSCPHRRIAVLLRPSARYIVNPVASRTPTLLLDRQHGPAHPLAHDASARVPALRRPPRSRIEQLNGKVSTFWPLHRHEQGRCHGLDEAVNLAGEIASICRSCQSHRTSLHEQISPRRVGRGFRTYEVIRFRRL